MGNLFNSDRYFLYNKDNLVAEFKCIRQNNMPSFSFIKQYNDFLPYGFNKDDVTSFVKSRKAPSNREHIQEILNKCGCNDLEGLIRFSYCASLNDTFWIKPEDKENINWNKVSLYKNKFNENIAKIAFDGGLMGEQMSSASPELGTDGSFAKCWKRLGENIYLFKRNGIAGRETLSESMAYEISKIICQNPTKYELFKYHNDVASRCKLFSDENISYAPIARVLGNNATFNKCLNFFAELGEEDKFKEMMVLDALTLNTDRHLKNFGILYESETGQIISMAPVFDNNLSMLPYAHIDDLTNFKEYLPTRPCAFNGDFNEIAINCLTDKLKNSLNQICDFSFSNNPFYETDRIPLLTNIIRTQSFNILKSKTLTAYIPETQKSEILLDNLTITIDKSKLSQNDLDMFLSGNYCIPDFQIKLINNQQLQLSNISSSIIDTDDEVFLEIYNAKIINNTADYQLSDVDSLLNFHIKNKNNPDYSFMKIKCKEISIQLTKGLTQNISSLNNCSILIGCDIENEDIEKKHIL